MLIELLTAPIALKKVSEEIKQHTKEIREGVRSNGYCLDHICKDFRPTSK